jgi:uncharacterized protein (UPF0333 family)
MSGKTHSADRGQVATEYLVIFAFLLTAVTMLFAYSFLTINESVAMQKVKDSSSKISSAAESLAAFGEGSRSTITIELPNNVVRATANGNYILITLAIAGGDTDYFEKSRATFSYAELPTDAGRHEIVLEVRDGNVSITGG